MKKTTKILSLLMALVMILSLTTAAWGANATVTETLMGVKLYGSATVGADKYLRNNDEGTISKEVGETGFYQRLPRLTNKHTSCGTVLTELIPEWYVVNPKTDIKLSNPEVLTDCKFSLAPADTKFGDYAGNPCLQFNYKAAKAGSCDVKLTFYYSYEYSGASGYCDGCGEYVNVSGNKLVYKETTTFTVNVADDEPVAEDVTVTYTDGVENEEVFADQVYTVKVGDTTPAFQGDEPTREGYVFLGWEPEVAETVTGNATYTAKWEEALTEVKVTSNKGEGALLFLGDEIKVTVKTNVKADNIKITPTLNGAFTQVASDTAADGTKTIWYRVTKIIGNYTTLSFTATATKGNQPSVTDTLSFGVNLRNRIHVTVTRKVSGETVTDATVQLMHKYPQWNACPMLKFDAAKGEYVMKNAWDLSNQQFNAVNITIGDKTYSVNKTKDGRDLMSVILAGTEEIYVDYVVVEPITVMINVDGKVAARHEFEGNDNDKLDYSKLYWAVMDELRAAGAMPSVAITYDNDATAAVFGQCTSVTVNIMTNGTGITGTGDDFPWDSGKTITASGDNFVWGN